VNDCRTPDFAQLAAQRDERKENAVLCRDLMNGLIERDLPTDGSILHVIDGSKALHGFLRPRLPADRDLAREFQLRRGFAQGEPELLPKPPKHGGCIPLSHAIA